ncbi:hypothetical protein OQJ18_09970 [Fluoribacter dumoffii]|uniref:hypothetical protein n=1 Tax=Fluoribacter dumoffii TaxID=463 RepID=UPI002244698B|nr:hypothetical protein [Fluoribacter dumoffii]MCW8454582.1 hypothetical protein [Fluoribacter dumoffii]
MPLRPRLVVLNRLGLLDQVINQTNLEERRDSLINSPSTPPILKEYFILMREKKKIETDFFNELRDNPQLNTDQRRQLEESALTELRNLKTKFERFFEEYKFYEPDMTKVLQAHLHMNVAADKEGTWILFAANADEAYIQKNALPLIEELKKENFGIAYRMAAEIAVDDAEKRELLQRAAELGDVPAKGLIGFNYLAYLSSHAFDNTAPEYPVSEPASHPRDFMGQALKALDPDSVAKSMAYLANVASALSDLSNVAKQTAEAEKKIAYDPVLLSDDNPVTEVEKNKIYLSITNNKIKYTLEVSGEVLTGEISSEELGYQTTKRLFAEQKSFLVPDILKIIAERDSTQTLHNAYTQIENQSISDNKVLVMLDEADKITNDPELKNEIDAARKLIQQKDYRALKDIKVKIEARLTPYSQEQQQKVLEMLEKESKKELFINPELRADLNKLYDHYQQEIERIKNGDGATPSPTQKRNITLLQEAMDELFLLNEEQDPEKAKKMLEQHILVTETNIKKLPHPHSFLNFIEKMVNTYPPKKLLPKDGDFKITIKDEERSQMIKNFASFKQSLGIIKQQQEEATEKNTIPRVSPN